MKRNVVYLVVSLLILSLMMVYHHHEKQPAETRISGAYRALNFFSEQRAYPYNSIPDISHYSAYEKVLLQRLASRENQLYTPPWQTIGPHNTGGRTIAIAFNPQNPNTIYAGSASGGLWRSKTAGVGQAAWEYIPTGYPVLSVCSIDFAPGDSNTIYIGTGEVYNVGGGHQRVLKELFPLFEEISGQRVRIQWDESQKGDVPHTSADIGKAARDLAYAPRTSLETGLKQEWDWVKTLYA